MSGPQILQGVPGGKKLSVSVRTITHEAALGMAIAPAFFLSAKFSMEGLESPKQ
jgi:hypothetical protein